MTLLLLSRIVLAGLFVVAVSAKLTDRRDLRRSMAGLGIPLRLVAPLGWALIGSELVVAGLLCSPAAIAGGIGSLALLAAFDVVVVVNLYRGRTPDCHCFGRVSRGPIGWASVARNGCLMAVAGYVAGGGRAAAAFAGVLAAAVGLWAWLGPPSSRIRRASEPPPDFSLVDQEGATWTLGSLLAPAVPALLIFSHPGCGACRALLPEVARWQHRLGHRLRVIVVCGGSPPTSAERKFPDDLGTVLVDESGEVARAYGVFATPSAVLIDWRGRRSGATAEGAGEIAQLVERASGTGRVPDEPRLGRRRVLGMATVGVFSVVAAACGATTSATRRPKSLHLDGAYLCDQRYALCTNAACVPDRDDPSIVICDCVVKTGYAIGFKSCADRAPTGATLYSNFSTQLVTDRTRVLSCPAEDRWANCLDVVCSADPHDSTKAHCQCLLVDAGPSVTFGGECKTTTCSSVIWSAATPDLPGSTQLEKGMKQLGLPLTLPEPCPSH